MDRLTPILERIRQRPNYQVEWGGHAMRTLRMLRARDLREAFDSDDYAGRAARAFASALLHVPRRIGPGERIVGWVPALDDDALARAEAGFWRHDALYARDFKGWGAWDGSWNHMVVDYERALREGLGAICARLASRLAALDPADPAAVEPGLFLQAARQALLAHREFCGAYAGLARAQAQREPDPARQAELREVARICDKVPWQPAETYPEALQAVHFVYLGHVFDMPSVTGLGRLDQMLAPYLDADLAAGRLDEAQALELTRELCARLNEWSNIPQSIMLGGRGPDGQPFDHLATRLILRAARANRLLNPALGLACCDGMSGDLLDEALAMLAEGLSQPALFGDATITRGLVEAGIAPADARTHAHATCTEMTVPGRSNILATAGHVNLLKALEPVLPGPADGVTPPDPPSFDALLAQVKDELARLIAQCVVQVNRKVWRRARFDPKPFTSCLVDDCIERQTDIAAGGARYNHAVIHGLGLANLADSLLAVRRMVYEQHRLTLDELRQALRANFAGHEPLRLELQGRLPKCGQDDAEAQALATELFEWFCGQVNRHRTPHGPCMPGFLVSRGHVKHGKASPASPDGRRAGEPLADSLAAMQGRATAGPTALLRSAAVLGLHRCPGAANVNLQLPEELLAEPASRAKLAAMLMAHFAEGGFQVQLTVTSAEQLRQARRDPASFGHLIVRVGGYSDYFTRLEPALQEAILARSESPTR